MSVAQANRNGELLAEVPRLTLHNIILWIVSNPEIHIVNFRKRRWVDNIKMDLREIEWNGVDWIDMAQDRDQWMALVNTVR
jgi:hypothetical protein